MAGYGRTTGGGDDGVSPVLLLVIALTAIATTCPGGFPNFFNWFAFTLSISTGIRTVSR
ncbi:MAG: hypothetical protein JW913_13170 [Chitinispirillaceae bacterium]|nr:hypothetical protein [Chitinispirillaceae bacterium]